MIRGAVLRGSSVTPVVIVYWIESPLPGRLAIAPRPRGGEWLREDIARWRREGIDAAISTLTSGEIAHFDLRDEAQACRDRGIRYESIEIEDRQTPSSRAKVIELAQQGAEALGRGDTLAIHCRQGIGRSSLIAACILLAAGLSVGDALERIASARGLPVPETDAQRKWIEEFGAAIPAVKLPPT